MSLTSLGNCRHYWEFNNANFSGSTGTLGSWTDSQGGAEAQLSGAGAAFTTHNGVQGLVLTAGDYLTVPEVETIGEVSFIGVYGYRGGGAAYGWCTLTSLSGFNFYQLFSSNNAQFWRSASAATTNAPLDQSGVNIHSMGTRNASGIIWGQVDDDPEVTKVATPAANDTAIITHDNWQFGRRYTTEDPIQQIYETAIYIGDVSQDPNYATEIAALKTKYGL